MRKCEQAAPQPLQSKPHLGDGEGFVVLVGCSGVAFFTSNECTEGLAH